MILGPLISIRVLAILSSQELGTVVYPPLVISFLVGAFPGPTCTSVVSVLTGSEGHHGLEGVAACVSVLRNK